MVGFSHECFGKQLMDPGNSLLFWNFDSLSLATS